MEQEQINALLAFLAVFVPVITTFGKTFLDKHYSSKKDSVEYGEDLLKLANDATAELRKAREDLNSTEDRYEEVIKTMRDEYEGIIKSIRVEADARHESLKKRIAELERVTRMYTVSFDLVTHPNIEVKNIRAERVDDPKSSQRIKAITPEDIAAYKNKKGGD